MDSPLFEDARVHLEPGSFKPKETRSIEEIAEGPSGLLSFSPALVDERVTSDGKIETRPASSE